MRPPGEKPNAGERLFTFRSGGWVLLLAAVVGVVVLLQTLHLIDEHRQTTFGDGKNVETYRFDLEPCLVNREFLVAANMPRNGARALTDPTSVDPVDLDASPNRKVRKLLVSKDRVIGVTVGGESRAYPLPIVKLHEVVNDTLGGVPIAVTYHPLCDSVVVFDRRVEGREAPVEFRVSGLLWNSNQLLFIHQEKAGGESLWSQLQARAVTGPDAAAGRRLTVIRSSVLPWGEWKKRTPDTTVIYPDPVYLKQYPRKMYLSYFDVQKPRFKVDPKCYPPPSASEWGFEAWDRVVESKLDERDFVVGPAEGSESDFHAFYWAYCAARSGPPRHHSRR